jgi:hypothetical protein
MTSNIWGTNNHGPSERWGFEIGANGGEYSSVDDCEIGVYVQ